MAKSTEDEGGPEKNSSMITQFTVWNTMAGSSVLTIPWAYSESGLIMGFVITTASFAVSLWTCKLCMDVTDPRGDFFDAVKHYLGPINQGIAIISFMLICLSAIIA